MSQVKRSIQGTAGTEKPRRFVFVLLDNFTLLSFASALDCLRLANRRYTSPVYEWVLIGEGGESAKSSTDTEFNLDNDLIELHRDDTIILCGGIHIQQATTKKLLNWLRRESRKGAAIGGLCTAAHVLARHATILLLLGVAGGTARRQHQLALHQLLGRLSVLLFLAGAPCVCECSFSASDSHLHQRRIRCGQHSAP